MRITVHHGAHKMPFETSFKQIYLVLKILSKVTLHRRTILSQALQERSRKDPLENYDPLKVNQCVWILQGVLVRKTMITMQVREVLSP